MTIRWSTLVARPEDGTIDYARLRSLVAVLLALLGGGVTAAVTLTTLLSTTKQVDTGVFSIMVAALVLPLTGGKLADAWRAKTAANSGGPE